MTDYCTSLCNIRNVDIPGLMSVKVGEEEEDQSLDDDSPLEASLSLPYNVSRNKFCDWLVDDPSRA